MSIYSPRSFYPSQLCCYIKLVFFTSFISVRSAVTMLCGLVAWLRRSIQCSNACFAKRKRSHGPMRSEILNGALSSKTSDPTYVPSRLVHDVQFLEELAQPLQEAEYFELSFSPIDWRLARKIPGILYVCTKDCTKSPEHAKTSRITSLPDYRVGNLDNAPKCRAKAIKPTPRRRP